MTQRLTPSCADADPRLPGRAYLYRYPGELGDLPAIVSLGADGQPGGEGVNQDIVSWRN